MFQTFFKKKTPNIKAKKNRADIIFRQKVRQIGYCQLRGLDNIQCWGVLECAHIKVRGHHVIRWNFKNALCICHSHHAFYTSHEKAWQSIVSRNFPDQWEFVQANYNKIWDGDINKVFEYLNEVS